MTNLRSKILDSRKNSNKQNIFYCSKCLYPSTKPNLNFSSDGVCSACRSFGLRKEIDWKKREEEFHKIMSKFNLKPLRTILIKNLSKIKQFFI